MDPYIASVAAREKALGRNLIRRHVNQVRSDLGLEPVAVVSSLTNFAASIEASVARIRAAFSGLSLPVTKDDYTLIGDDR